MSDCITIMIVLGLIWFFGFMVSFIKFGTDATFAYSPKARREALRLAWLSPLWPFTLTPIALRELRDLWIEAWGKEEV